MPNHLFPSHFDDHAKAAVLARVQASQAGPHVAETGFDYPTVLAGQTTNVSVYYDPALGQQGADLAAQFLGQCQAVFDQNNSWFAPKKSPTPNVNVIIAPLGGNNDGTGGAYHHSCNFKTGGDLYLDATFNATQPVPMLLGLFEAELDECSQGKQRRGWKCGWSNGEGLSRVLAEAVSGGPDGALAAFASGPAWAAAGKPNWVDASEPTDQKLPSTGCAVLFINWLVSLGIPLNDIVQAGCPKTRTLAACYQVLFGKTTAWADFSAAVAALPGPVTNDNPWG